MQEQCNGLHSIFYYCRIFYMHSSYEMCTKVFIPFHIIFATQMSDLKPPLYSHCNQLLCLMYKKPKKRKLSVFSEFVFIFIQAVELAQAPVPIQAFMRNIFRALFQKQKTFNSVCLSTNLYKARHLLLNENTNQ